MQEKVQQPLSGKAKQKTPRGLVIPVPKRSELMDALKKGVQPPKPKKP